MKDVPAILQLKEEEHGTRAVVGLDEGDSSSLHLREEAGGRRWEQEVGSMLAWRVAVS